MVYCVGLTGTIASGKSTVAHYFSKLGVEIISADAISKSLTMKTQPAFNEIVHHFGPTIVNPAGDLDRAHLRQLIFKSPKARLWLEKYLHPLIKTEIKRLIQTVKSPYCLIEIPLLKRRTDFPYLNRILLIQAHPEQQLARCSTRDKSSKNEVLIMLNTQLKTHPLLTKADDVLNNTGSLDELNHMVLKLHKQYLNQSIPFTNGSIHHNYFL